MFHKETRRKFNHHNRRHEEITFKISFLSSNNPDFFISKMGYVICKNEFGFHLKAAHVSFPFRFLSAFERSHHVTSHVNAVM